MTLTIRPGVKIKPGINVTVPLPPVSYSLTSVASNINEGSSLTFNVTTTAVPNGTILYWSTGFSGTNMSGGRLSLDSGSVTVSSGAASFSITVSADELTSPDQQEFIVRLYKDAPGGSGGTEVDQISINVNDTSLTRPQWANDDATASGGSVSYQYYKFHITKTKGADLYNATQISELIILNGSTRLTGGTATNPDGSNNEGEDASQAFDGYYDTKWCDKNYVTNSHTSTLIIDYGTAQTSNGFTFATGNDYPDRDPVQWTFEGSNNGSTWDIIQNQNTDASYTLSRSALVGTVFNHPVHGSAVFDGSSWLEVGSTYWTLNTGANLGGFNSGTPITLKDTSGNYYNTTLYDYANGTIFNVNKVSGMPQPGNNWRWGLGGDEPGYYIYSSSEPTQPWNLGRNSTIEWWQKAGNSIANGGTWIGGILTQNAGQSGIDIFQVDGMCVGNGNNNTGRWQEDPMPDEWSHVAVVSTWDGISGAGTISVYFNGVLQPFTSGQYSSYLQNASDTLKIGSRLQAGGQSFTGKITNIRILNNTDYTGDFTPTVLPIKFSPNTRFLWTPTDQSLVTDTADTDYILPITNHGATYSSDYPSMSNWPTFGFSGFPGFPVMQWGPNIANDPFVLTTSNIADGTTLYWQVEHIDTIDANFGAVSGSFTINTNTGSFTLPTPGGGFTNSGHHFKIRIRTGSQFGPVVTRTNSIMISYCVAPWTTILLADKTTTTAGDLTVGTMLWAQHETTLEWGEYAVTDASLISNMDRYTVTFDDSRELVATGSHPVLTTKGWKPIMDLVSGDEILQEVGTAIVSSLIYRDRGDVIKITVDSAHTYVSEGIISHNK